MRVARRQLKPPDAGPSIRPVRGEKTQPKVRKDSNPKTGLIGTKSVIAFMAEKVAMSDRVIEVGRRSSFMPYLSQRH